MLRQGDLPAARRGRTLAAAGYLVDPADIRNRIGNGEIEVVAGGVEW
jgi:hypothetical protein